MTNENKETSISYLILDTAKLVNDLRIRLKMLEELDFKESEIINLIFQSIMFERDAEMELAYECMNIVKECLGPFHSGEINNSLGTTYGIDVRVITNAMYKLGSELIKQLQHLKAYNNGYLFFNFNQMLGKDIVLEKFIPPSINDARIS